MNKVTGFRISNKALVILKFYCAVHCMSMSEVIEMLILDNLQLVGSLDPEAEENTSESE